MNDKKKENEEKLEEAIQVIMNASNYFDSDDVVSKALFKVISKEHRTISQSFFRAFNKFLGEYSTIGYDARNEQSVLFAKKVVELEHHFPLI